jgi:ElaB/YqjD/DUF883 family membrane-anchored ribosome-binding protein
LLRRCVVVNGSISRSHIDKEAPKRETKVMFQPRSTDFLDPRVSAIIDHLRAIESELGEIGKTAGRRASAKASMAGDQIADAVGPILSDLVDRFRRGQRAAADGAATLGDAAMRTGTRMGSDALERIASQAKQRPLLTVAVAIGVGILIGVAGRRS